jgi:hypothetical protein
MFTKSQSTPLVAPAFVAPPHQTKQAAYGTVEYILRLDMHKRSLANRAIIYATGVIITTSTLGAMVYAAWRLDQEGVPRSQTYGALSAYVADLLLQCLSCAILLTDVGLLPDFYCRDVPYVHLPTAWYVTSDYILANLLKFAFLEDRDILGLPANLDALVDEHELPEDIATGVCVGPSGKSGLVLAGG